MIVMSQKKILNGKGQAPIIIMLRVIIAVVGLVLLLLGINNLSSPSTWQEGGAGLVKILVGLALVVLGIRPESLRYILQARIPT